MGIAAYRRGSAAITRDICRSSGCRGCVWCSSPRPTPRPLGHGDATMRRAVHWAVGFLAHTRGAGTADPSVDDLAWLIREAVRIGKKPAQIAAAKALSESI